MPGMSAVAAKLSPPVIAGAIKREPLVGVTAASKILGIPTPNFKRDAAPHLIALPVEGSAAVYFRSEVRELARELRRRRRARSNGRTPS